METLLPGGLSLDGRIERDARFRPLTGRIEQALIELDIDDGRAGYVTAVLGQVLQSIAGKPVKTRQISRLCVADRQFLMLRLAAMIDGEHMWLKAGCGHCDEAFDVEINRCDLPVKPAGAGFPMTALHLGDRTIDARVPTGIDQERIEGLQADVALRRLLSRCILRVNGAPVDATFVDGLSDRELDIIDAALDELSPAVCDRLLVRCPSCEHEQQAELDHYSLAGIKRHFFYDEIHTLASHYHWSEAEILDLPQHRRRLYLDLINRSAGRVEQRPVS